MCAPLLAARPHGMVAHCASPCAWPPSSMPWSLSTGMGTTEMAVAHRIPDIVHGPDGRGDAGFIDVCYWDVAAVDDQENQPDNYVGTRRFRYGPPADGSVSFRRYRRCDVLARDLRSQAVLEVAPCDTQASAHRIAVSYAKCRWTRWIAVLPAAD
jgi:hypothetical protein